MSRRITASAITQPLKVYFTFGGTANLDVDYLTALVAAEDTDPGPMILLPSGIGRVIIEPTAGSPLGAGHHAITFALNPLQDSRTEGTESATVTLLPHPAYRIVSPSAGSVNITDDDTPKIPANGYTITDLGDSFHTVTVAAGINNNAPPQIAGSYVNVSDPNQYPHVE